MKIYDKNTNIITKLPSVLSTEGGLLYTNKMSESDLNAHGYYYIQYESKPNRRYYTSEETKELIENKYIISYTKIPHSLDTIKESMLKDLKEAFNKYSERPRVDTGLGYFVDGSRDDKENFEIGKDLGLPKVKDADNQWHDVTAEDYDTIILAIKQNSVDLWYTKNTKEAEIKSLVTVEDCILYESTPYEVEELDEDGKTVIVTKYKNNVKEWF